MAKMKWEPFAIDKNGDKFVLVRGFTNPWNILYEGLPVVLMGGCKDDFYLPLQSAIEFIEKQIAISGPDQRLADWLAALRDFEKTPAKS